ncbi:MAG TPA: hypothetical protein VMM18_16675 [Gemmatimonadaceae bacterium]|nr:hypothetical protein [Gemmatimonadaceae bacterium]
MKKFLLALAIGLSAGYFYGFADAKEHPKNIVSRAVDRVGDKGATYRTDVDAQMKAVDKGR